MMKSLKNPYLLLTLTALFWSGNMVVGRGIRADVPPLAMAFWRWLLAFLLILPLAAPHFRTQWPLLHRSWPSVTLLGLLGVGGYNTFAYLALQTTTATNAVLLNSFIPVATMAIAWIVLGKRLSLPACLGVAVSLAGALTIVARGELAVLLNFNLNQGDLWMLLAITVWALYTIGLAWRPAGVDAMLLLAAFTAVGLAALLPAYLWEMAQGHSIHTHAGSLAALAYVGIFPSFIGYIFYNRGVAEVGASRASLFIHLMPVFGTLLSAIFLGEQPQHFHYVGISLIFIGIFLTMRKG